MANEAVVLVTRPRLDLWLEPQVQSRLAPLVGGILGRLERPVAVSVAVSIGAGMGTRDARPRRPGGGSVGHLLLKGVPARHLGRRARVFFSGVSPTSTGSFPFPRSAALPAARGCQLCLLGRRSFLSAPRTQSRMERVRRPLQGVCPRGANRPGLFGEGVVVWCGVVWRGAVVE